MGPQNKSVVIESDLDNAGATINDRWFYLDKLDRTTTFSTKTASGQANRIDRQFDNFR